MLRNSLGKLFVKPAGFSPLMALVLPAWVFVGFMLAQVVVGLLLALLNYLNVPLDAINNSTLQTIGSLVIYLLSIAIVIGLAWGIKRLRTTKDELGLNHYPTWTDLLLAPAGFIVYLFLSFVLTSLAALLPFYNVDQIQDTGFSGLTYGFEYLLAFITLVIVAPIAEEILFRGYLLGKLRQYVPVWVAVLVTSILFGLVHFAWNVGVDVFALSIILCILRLKTGRLWPSIVLHMIKNSLAFYFLFINPIF